MNLLDLLFPPRCVLCRRVLEKRNDLGLCRWCTAKEYAHPEPVQPEGRCSFLYEERMQDALRRLKYEGRKEYGVYFARWMYQEGQRWAETQGFDRMTAVPLAAVRLQSRGYNQAELIARELSGYAGHPMKPCWNVPAKRRLRADWALRCAAAICKKRFERCQRRRLPISVLWTISIPQGARWRLAERHFGKMAGGQNNLLGVGGTDFVKIFKEGLTSRGRVCYIHEAN